MSTVGYYSFEADGAFFVYDTTTNALVEAPESVHHALEACRRNSWIPLDSLHLLAREMTPADVAEARGWLREAGRRGMLQPYVTRDYTWLLDRDPREELASLTGLILGITGRCNFRCRYCTLSGHYPGLRQHSKESMSWSVIRRSLDFFIPRAVADSWLLFYGGEPTLEWDLIESAVGYVRKHGGRRSDLGFTVSTNGSLLDESKIDFLMQNRGSLIVSLDGPADIHDRMRKYKNGESTFVKVIKSLALIRLRDEAWYRSHVTINCVLTRRDNFSEVMAFFSGHELLSDVGVRAVRLHTGMDPDYKEALGIQRIVSEGPADIPDAYFKFLSGAGDGFSYHLFSSLHSSIFQGLLTRRPGFAPTWATAHGMCYPGANRLYVDAAGGLYICQLLDIPDGKIGDVDRGFDYERIRAVVRSFAEFCQGSCQECWVQRLCEFCVAHAETGGQVHPENLNPKCLIAREQWKTSLRTFAYVWKKEEELGLADRFWSLHSCLQRAQSVDSSEKESCLEPLP